MTKINRRRPGAVFLKDLGPRGNVMGGAGKRVFGEQIDSTIPAKIGIPPKTGKEKKGGRRSK